MSRTLTALIALTAGAAAPAVGQSDRKATLIQYWQPPAADDAVAVEVEYSYLRGEGGRPLAEADRSRVTVRAGPAGGLSRRTVVRAGGRPPAAGARPDPLRLYNPAYTAALVSNQADGSWVIAEFKRAGWQPADRDKFRRLWTRPWLRAGYVYLQDWVAEPEFQVTAVEPAAGGAARYHFRYAKARPAPPHPNRAATIPTGWLDVDPARGGVLTGYRYDTDTTDDRSTEVGTLVYDDRRPVPRLLRSVADTPNGATKAGKPVATREVAEYTYGPDPRTDDECYLSYYGLPEPAGVDDHRRPSVWRWVGLGAIGVLVAAAGRSAVARRRG